MARRSSARVPPSSYDPICVPRLPRFHVTKTDPRVRTRNGRPGRKKNPK